MADPYLNDNANAALAAFFGAIISRMFRPQVSPRMWVANWFASAVMAWFIGVPLARMMGNENAAGLIGIVTGLFLL